MAGVDQAKDRVDTHLEGNHRPRIRHLLRIRYCFILDRPMQSEEPFAIPQSPSTRRQD